MPTTKAHNNIHRQQLFHWIGEHIGRGDGARGQRAKLSDAQREEYLACLLGSFAHGLWMKQPREPEWIEPKPRAGFRQARPMTCFTEWSLDLSHPHSTKYGRLGLGFPKRWVLERGGQPVTYFKSVGQHRLFPQALAALRDHIITIREPDKIGRAAGRERV